MLDSQEFFRNFLEEEYKKSDLSRDKCTNSF